MPRRKTVKTAGLEDKLEYLGLDLNKIPKTLLEYEPIEYRVPRLYEEKQFRQYKYVPVKNIEIFLSPTNRLDPLEDRYKKASPLCDYLDNSKEENLEKFECFLNMLKNMNTDEILKVENEQLKLSKKIPFRVKYEGNYLWQIYYSESTDKYFMIVPTEESDCSTFFYLLKRKIEDKRNDKVFVPISNLKYSDNFLKKSEYPELENNLWLFTKDWPLIYEVFDKNDESSLQIVGETNVYEKIKTTYKLEFKTQKKAEDFYKLIKALFILQTELPHYFNFTTNIDKNGKLELYLDDYKIEYDSFADFVREQYKNGLKMKKETKSKIRFYKKKLEELKETESLQELEYVAKERQITTFLECKKTFFGKFKYFFKYSKKKTSKVETKQETISEENNTIIKDENDLPRERKRIPIKKIYKLEELIDNYKELDELQETMKNLLMDVNALKLKIKNMTKKIENASKFIEEIDRHKKSIFEFWKYSNKDEVNVLPEGEVEEVNVVKKIEKSFDYVDDFEEFGKKLDKMQRRILSDKELDSIFIASTNLIVIMNKIKAEVIKQEELEQALKQLKMELKYIKFSQDDEYDVLGNIVDASIKAKRINGKKHREEPRDKFDILDIDKNTRTMEFKLELNEIIDTILKATRRNLIPESLPVYKAIPDGKINENYLNVFNINPENEIMEALSKNSKSITLYKINIKEGTNGVGFTNIVFYNNQNKTLPVGMDLSSKILINTQKLHLQLKGKKEFKLLEFEDEKDDFSNVNVKNIETLEYDIVTFDENENQDEE